jgi:sporulation-control protein
LFKKILASLGVGAAKIDLVLDSDVVTMGEEVTGKVYVEGGEVEQLIEELEVHFNLASSFKKDDEIKYVNETIATIPVMQEEFVVRPGEKREFDFYFKCPELLPVSSVNTRYYFQSNLEIISGIDAKDRDVVDVKPSGLLKNFLGGFAKLGFVHYGEGYTGQRNGGVQIIQFHATDWMRGKFDEIVFQYKPKQAVNSVRGFFELDKKTKGLIGMLADELDLDEKKGAFEFRAEELSSEEAAAETIRNFIIKNSSGLITG